MKRTIIAIFALTALLMTPYVLAQPTHPHNADAMWIEDCPVDITDMSVGDRFNITVWINLTVDSAGWQFLIIYDEVYLNASRIGYTAGDKSDFFRDLQTIGVPANLVGNATHHYVLHGESWIFGPFRGPGYGSLSWVEFEIMATPPFNTELTLSDHHPPTSMTYALTPTQEEINLTIDHCPVVPEFPSLLPILLLTLALPVIIVAARKKKIE